MSLDVTLRKDVWSGNITHNLVPMARAVGLSNGLTLYDVLWRPEEHGIESVSDVREWLYEGYTELSRHPDKYKLFNPANGWGSYEGLINFVRDYLAMCDIHPDSGINASR